MKLNAVTLLCLFLAGTAPVFSQDKPVTTPPSPAQVKADQVRRAQLDQAGWIGLGIGAFGGVLVGTSGLIGYEAYGRYHNATTTQEADDARRQLEVCGVLMPVGVVLYFAGVTSATVFFSLPPGHDQVKAQTAALDAQLKNLQPQVSAH